MQNLLPNFFRLFFFSKFPLSFFLRTKEETGVNSSLPLSFSFDRRLPRNPRLEGGEAVLIKQWGMNGERRRGPFFFLSGLGRFSGRLQQPGIKTKFLSLSFFFEFCFSLFFGLAGLSLFLSLSSLSLSLSGLHVVHSDLDGRVVKDLGEDVPHFQPVLLIQATRNSWYGYLQNSKLKS